MFDVQLVQTLFFRPNLIILRIVDSLICEKFLIGLENCRLRVIKKFLQKHRCSFKSFLLCGLREKFSFSYFVGSYFEIIFEQSLHSGGTHMSLHGQFIGTSCRVSSQLFFGVLYQFICPHSSFWGTPDPRLGATSFLEPFDGFKDKTPERLTDQLRIFIISDAVLPSRCNLSMALFIVLAS